MLPERKTPARVGIIVGFILSLVGNAIARISDNSVGQGVGGILALVAFVVFIWGCWNLAKGKGYSGLLGLLGILSCLGLLVLVILPDKHPES